MARVSILEEFKIDGEPDNIKEVFRAGKLELFYPDTPLPPEDVVGRTIIEVHTECGNYGMGGVGMFALRLDGKRQTFHPQQDPEGECLIIALRAAKNHLLLDNYKSPWRELPKVKNLEKKLIGKKILGLFIDDNDFKIVLEKRLAILFDHFHDLVFSEGEESKRADLRKSIFLSPTVYLWV